MAKVILDPRKYSYEEKFILDFLSEEIKRVRHTREKLKCPLKTDLEHAVLAVMKYYAAMDDYKLLEENIYAKVDEDDAVKPSNVVQFPTGK